MQHSQTAKTRSLVEVSLFSAIVVALAFMPFVGYIPLGFTRATTVHIPVILASILLGPKKGGFIGLVFGLTSLWKNTFEPTLTSFTFSPFYAGGNMWSLVICLVPRILVGVVPHYVFRLGKRLAKGAESLPLIVAGLAGSLTNTLLVMNGIYIFFGSGYAMANADKIAQQGTTLYGFILGIIGLNGVPEAIVAALITAAVGKALLHVLGDRQAGTKPL
ncbi:MAG: ECF transporter S component [Eubacteriales bacterium]|jgi:uncharacterized membrane protein